MGILDRWNQYRDQKQRQRQKEAALVEMIERMVQNSDPSMRKVAGYRQHLQKPVENALRHVEGLISSIPSPISLSEESWDKDPMIHSLFVSPDEIRSLLKSCDELKSFFQQSGAETAVVLITATKKERTVFGTAQEGEIIQRDVPQMVVEFYDHKVVAPVATEAENRRELVHRGLNLLATYALEEILQIHSIREELTAERRMLAVKLKIQRSRERGMESLLAGGSKNNADEDGAQQLLSEIDKQLMELEPGSGTPRGFMQKLEKVLLNPGDVLTGNKIRMHLNWIGAKLKEESAGSGREINLAELEIPGRVKRVAVLATITCHEFMENIAHFESVKP